MARKIELPEETDPQATELPPEAEADGANGKQKKPARAPRPQLPNRAEIDAMIAELHAELTGDDREAAEKAARLCRLGSPRAAERLLLFVYGSQPATQPQVVMSSIAILKGGGVVDKHAAGITADTVEHGG